MLDELDELFWKPIIYLWQSSSRAKKDDVLPKLTFRHFTIRNFRGIDRVDIDLHKNDLVLLLGLNESGKSTILKAVEAFSFVNDPSREFVPDFYQSLRRKSDIGGNTSTIITATISIEDKLLLPEHLPRLGSKSLTQSDRQEIDSFLSHLNDEGEVIISRVFPFKTGKPQKYYYCFESTHPFANSKLACDLAIEIVNVSPFVIYFEDFKDRIPEKIFVNEKRKDSFDPMWYDIIDGLFYNTAEDFSIEMFRKLYTSSTPLLDDARTVLRRVNKTLNKTFTNKWKELSGVKEIADTELEFFHSRQTPYFTLKITDEDGTTFSVDERSKGALWYLAFLMKTEFRSKKLRKRSGKAVFLIDEPASNLHSTAQTNMINDFKKLAEETSIIYTTHSQYLISLQNIKNTMIVEKVNGVVQAEKWGVYLNSQNAEVSYYQPLANLLNIIPTSFDIPWKDCVITEGPSDRHFFVALYRILNKCTPDFAVYPGSSATSLKSLISLNLGWNANFRVLLDSDEEGDKAAAKYREMFGLDSEVVQLPKAIKEVEKCLNKKELEGIRDLVFSENKGKALSKKEFSSLWSLLAEDASHDEEIRKIIGEKSTETLIKIFKSIGH